MLLENFVFFFMLYIFVTCSCFDCSAASRKRGTGDELVGMVKDGTVCGVNKVKNYIFNVLLTTSTTEKISYLKTNYANTHYTPVHCHVSYALSSLHGSWMA